MLGSERDDSAQLQADLSVWTHLSKAGQSYGIW